MNITSEGFVSTVPCSVGQHTCLFFSSPQEQVEETLPFLLDGLDGGERCIVLAPDPVLDMLSEALEARGVLLDDDALHLGPLAAWREMESASSIRMARRVWAMIEEAMWGFSGLRLVVDAAWSQTAPPMPASQLCHLEATLDYLYAIDLPLQVLCQYNRDNLPRDVLHAGLRTHRQILSRGALITNDHYEVPEILDNEPHLNHCTGNFGSLERLLGTLQPI